MKSITFKRIADSCNVVPSACNTFFHQQETNSPAMSLLWESTHSKLLANSIKFPLYFSPRQHQLPSSYLFYLRSIACLPILREFMFLNHITSTNIETTPYFETRIWLQVMLVSNDVYCYPVISSSSIKTRSY